MHEPFIYRFKPFSFLLPEVKKPLRKVSFFQRFIYTLICIVIFLIMSSVPLYGYIQRAREIRVFINRLCIYFGVSAGSMIMGSDIDENHTFARAMEERCGGR